MTFKSVLFFLGIILCSLSAFTQTWNGSSSGDWNTASNWTPATVPTAASAVSIPNTTTKPVLANNIAITSRIAHWNGSLWEDLGNGASSGSSSGTVTTGGPVNNFSPFTFASTDVVLNPLPVQLLFFSAQKQRDATLVTFRAENEINFLRYEIERSANGVNFTKIRTVLPARTSGSHQYSFIDNAPQDGKNFYRLRMIDVDGSFKNSLVEVVLFSKSSLISIYPNPAHDNIRIVSSKEVTAVSITDVAGRLVKKFLPAQDGKYGIHDLKPGVYFIKVTEVEGSNVSRVIIQ